MRRAPAVLAAALACFALACDSTAPEAPAPSRFASAQKQSNTGAAAAFCEKQWPAGAGERRFAEIPERPVPGAPPAAAARRNSWKWVNLWATWCLPCVEEMGLLTRWRTSLEKDGIDVDLELWSVDEDESRLASYLAETAVPGRVRWLRSPKDLPAVLESLGAERTSAIPVHALVDGNGNLRCLRVGSVHDEDYGAVKAILSGR